MFRVESKKFSCWLHCLQSLYTTFCFLSPVRLTLTLTLTSRVLGTSCCVLLLQVLYRMKKLLSGVKRALSSNLSSRGSGSCSADNGSQDSRSSSFMPSSHETAGSCRYLTHDDVLVSMDGDDISIRTTNVTPSFEAKTRCTSYVCPGSSCHTYGQNVNIENQCLQYISCITRILYLHRRLLTLSSSSSGTSQPHRQSTGGNARL
jgi:hypothetical protein